MFWTDIRRLLGNLAGDPRLQLGDGDTSRPPDLDGGNVTREDERINRPTRHPEPSSGPVNCEQKRVVHYNLVVFMHACVLVTLHA